MLSVVVKGKQPTSSERARPVYGPEPWHTVAGVVWSWWDLWLAVVCVVDHGGDWDALDAALAGGGGPSRSGQEARWSHLLDLTHRLAEAGLTAAELVGELATDRALRTRARTKVLRSTLYGRDLTPAMSNPPSARVTHRALFGSWPQFPRTPQPWYEQLAARFPVLDRYAFDGLAAQKFAYRIGAAVSRLGSRVTTAAEALALRRGALTFYYQVMEGCDDSYGGVGDVIQEAVIDYVGTDWRAAGVRPEVFWRDLLEWAVLASNYGLLGRDESLFLRKAGVPRELDLVEQILAELTIGYTAARMSWHAGQALQLHAQAVATAGALHRFMPVEGTGCGDGLGMQLEGLPGVPRELDLVEQILAELTIGYTAARMSWHACLAQEQRLVPAQQAVVGGEDGPLQQIPPEHLGAHACGAPVRTDYVRTDWRAAGVRPEVFWRDLLEWAVLASNYGLLGRDESLFLRKAGVPGHPGRGVADGQFGQDLLDQVEFPRHAGQALQLHAQAVATAGALHRHEPVEGTGCGDGLGMQLEGLPGVPGHPGRGVADGQFGQDLLDQVEFPRHACLAQEQRLVPAQQAVVGGEDGPLQQIPPEHLGAHACGAPVRTDVVDDRLLDDVTNAAVGIVTAFHHLVVERQRTPA